jgi:23S rRNA (adenine2503-C2)-methyltransferase
MTDLPAAPITQDVLTLPRRLPEGGLTNLVGLTRDQLREALIATGTPEGQVKMRVGQVWQWLYNWGVRDFAQMTNLAKEFEKKGWFKARVPTKSTKFAILGDLYVANRPVPT